MPTMYRDENTGAKIYKNTKSERDIESIHRKIDIIDMKIDRIERLLQTIVHMQDIEKDDMK